MWNSTIFGVKLLKSCKLLNLSYALGDDDDGSGVFHDKESFLCFKTEHFIVLCSIGIQEMHISRAVGHELIKVADSICISDLQPPNLHLKLKMICMHTVGR